MAEQTSHDVVNQTRSGGEPSSSDVPASKFDNYSAEGDVGRITKNELNLQAKPSTIEQPIRDTRTMDTNEAERFSGDGNKDLGRQGSAAVATRALELNGVASLSDGGEDGGSLGGSDTDTSRTEGRQHVRTGSVKKPTGFKPVSFAKFSVPKAPGSSTAPKLGEKPTLSATSSSSSPQPSSRPRLVAKTTSGLGSSSKPVAAGFKGPSGPDASQVWNKNRPAQPPPTKHLTDEELKQQYGIHMTSRIQEDGNGTEAKWADIDDDEDDWAPETIEWNDGTKINLTHTENAQPPTQETTDRSEPKEGAIPPQAPVRDNTRVLVTKPSTTVGPNATVLRLGANAERQQQQAKAAAIASKSGFDRPTLTTKSPAPVPMKSPWASLPPVAKVSPVNPPVQTVAGQHITRFPSREQTLPEKGANAVPTREIAADDFNRSWREGQPNVPRELYNSQSGRYEPVPDTRKGSIRNDPHMRPATVLQRPGHSDSLGPAEPSAAFQTQRSSHQQEGGHWGRRRASSNVSGGSGSYGRRMSIGRPDVHVKPFEGRRGSQVNGVLDHSTSPSETASYSLPPDQSPHQASVIPSQPRPSSNISYAPPNAQAPGPQISPEEPNQETGPSAEDVILMQQRIMKEKRLEARQRRLEQEQKEEAERRERIRLKLEAMGPPPDKEKEPQTTTLATTTSLKDPTSTSTVHHTVQSPPKPPVPEPSGEPKQYGMMRVHHPESVKKLVAANERVVDKPSIVPIVSRRSMSPNHDVKAETVKPNGVLQDDTLLTNDQNAEISALDDKDQQWKNNQNSSYSPWAAGPKLSANSSPSSNMWKPLSIDKTLGNGTFDRNLTAFSHELSLRGPVGLAEPSPIGPISTKIDKSGSSQSFAGARLGPDSKSPLVTLPSPDATHPPYEPFQPIARPRPIGPPNSQHSHWQSDSRRGIQAATSAWSNFHAVAAKQDAESNTKFQRELEAMRDEPPASLNVTFAETWRQVRTGDQAGQREVIDVVKSNKPTGGSLPTLHSFDASVDSLPFPESHSRPFGNVINRGSRFFPTITDSYRGPVAVDDGWPRSPSPPPPEASSTHPAYSGDSHRPLVNLPIPKPVVRLPPKINQQPPKPPTFASMAATPLRPTQPQPSARATSWQDRINGLFGKVTPEKKHILAVASASKEPLEVQSHPHPAAVSLPQIQEIDGDATGLVASKEVEEEEAIFEDREAGSLPVVRVPVMAPPNAWHAALPPPARLRPKILRSMQVHSVEPYTPELPKRDLSGNWNILVHFPGSENVTSVAFSKKLPVTSSRPKGNSSSNFRTRKHTKPREPSAKYNSSQNNKRHNSSPNAAKTNDTQ